MDGGERFAVRATTDGPVHAWRLERDGETLHLTDELPVRPVDVVTAHWYASRDPGSSAPAS